MNLSIIHLLFVALLASGPSAGDPLPFFRLPVMNAEASGMTALATSRFVGPDAEEPKRGLVLSFAARSCKPCMKELPQLAALAARRGDVQFAVVDIDTEAEEQAALGAVLAELKITLPVLADRLGIVARRYSADTLPYLVLAGTDEKIRWVKKGYNEDVLAELERQLDALPPAPTPKKETP